MGMNLSDGGHLTHGHPLSFSGSDYTIVDYKVNAEGYIDYDNVREIALRERPKMIIAGASAYPREIDFARFRDSGGARGGAASRLDSAPPTGLLTRLWVLVETRAHPTALPGERRQCWRHALGGGSTFPAGLGVNVVVLALLWRPDCLLQGVAHIRWRHGLGGSRARGSTTFLAGLRMNIVLALRPVFLRESPTHSTCQPMTDQPTRSHSTLPKLRRDVMPFTAATSKPGMGKHPQHPASSP